jgi:hypothetical protein
MEKELHQNDWSIIEHAVKEAMTASVDYQSILAYKELLYKLKGEKDTANTLQVNLDVEEPLFNKEEMNNSEEGSYQI